MSNRARKDRKRGAGGIISGETRVALPVEAGCYIAAPAGITPHTRRLLQKISDGQT